MCLAERQHIPILVFGLTRPVFEPTIYHIRGEHVYHYTTDAVHKIIYLSSSVAERKDILTKRVRNTAFVLEIVKKSDNYFILHFFKWGIRLQHIMIVEILHCSIYSSGSIFGTFIGGSSSSSIIIKSGDITLSSLLLVPCSLSQVCITSAAVESTKMDKI